MLWVRLALLEISSFEFAFGRKIVLPLFLAVVFLLTLILIQNIFLLSFRVRWERYCIINDYGASVGEVGLHLFLALNMCQELFQ